MAMTVQQIIEAGTVDEQVPIQTLNETMALLDFQVQQLKVCAWGDMADAQIMQHIGLMDQIQQQLNRHYGSDGMTPLPA